jgi:predicted transcriptional regulator
MKKKATVQVEEEVRKILSELKIRPRESYNLVIRRLIENKVDEELLSKETIKAIERSLEDIKEGRVYSTKEVLQKTLFS